MITNNKILYKLNDKVRMAIKDKLALYQNDTCTLPYTTLIQNASTDIGLDWNYAYRIFKYDGSVSIKAACKIAKFACIDLSDFDFEKQITTTQTIKSIN